MCRNTSRCILRMIRTSLAARQLRPRSRLAAGALWQGNPVSLAPCAGGEQRQHPAVITRAPSLPISRLRGRNVLPCQAGCDITLPHKHGLDAERHIGIVPYAARPAPSLAKFAADWHVPSERGQRKRRRIARGGRTAASVCPRLATSENCRVAMLLRFIRDRAHPRATGVVRVAPRSNRVPPWARLECV